MRKSLFIGSLTLALTLSACGDGAGADATGAVASGEAIEKIAAPAGKQWSEVVSQTEDGGYVMGNPDAPIKLVEYMSITCSHCKDFGDQAFDSIRDDYVASGRVSFEVRNFVRDPLDLTAAILSRCGGEGPFFALTKQALSNQEAMFTSAQGMGEAEYNSILQLPEKDRFVALAEKLGLISFFQQRGVSADQAKACLSETGTSEKLIADTQKAGEKYNIPGTPTFLINGQMVEGTNWAIIETKLKEAGAR